MMTINKSIKLLTLILATSGCTKESFVDKYQRPAKKSPLEKQLDGYNIEKSPELNHYQILCSNIASSLPELNRWGCKIITDQGRRIELKEWFSIWRWHGWYQKQEKIVEVEDVSRFHPQFHAVIILPAGTEGQITFHAIEKTGTQGTLSTTLK